MHRVEGDAAEGYLIRLDGPMSLFKSSGRYGLQMASFLPTLLHFDRWSLNARLNVGQETPRARLPPVAGDRPQATTTA